MSKAKNELESETVSKCELEKELRRTQQEMSDLQSTLDSKIEQVKTLQSQIKQGLIDKTKSEEKANVLQIDLDNAMKELSSEKNHRESSDKELLIAKELLDSKIDSVTALKKDLERTKTDLESQTSLKDDALSKLESMTKEASAL